jgi:hypothetical protein
MEGANEAARRAVNEVLVRSNTSGRVVDIWPLQEPATFEPWKRLDERLLEHGKPHLFMVCAPLYHARDQQPSTERYGSHGGFAAEPAPMCFVVDPSPRRLCRRFERVVWRGGTGAGTRSAADPAAGVTSTVGIVAGVGGTSTGVAGAAAGTGGGATAGTGGGAGCCALEAGAETVSSRVSANTPAPTPLPSSAAIMIGTVKLGLAMFSASVRCNCTQSTRNRRTRSSSNARRGSASGSLPTQPRM